MILLIMVLLLLVSCSIVLSMAVTSGLSWLYGRLPKKVRALEDRVPAITSDQVLFVALICVLFSLAYFWGYRNGFDTIWEQLRDPEVLRFPWRGGWSL